VEKGWLRISLFAAKTVGCAEKRWSSHRVLE
jgi:hypothetical protein